MKNRIVYIKVPVLIECSTLNVKETTEALYGSGTFVSCEYQQVEGDYNRIVLALLEQQNIINKIMEI